MQITAKTRLEPEELRESGPADTVPSRGRVALLSQCVEVLNTQPALRKTFSAEERNWFSRARTRRDAGRSNLRSITIYFTMPDNCKSMTLRDANNNTYPAPVNGNVTDRSGNPPGSRQRSIQVTAKVLFGSVHAINRLKEAEKAARENKRI